MVLAVTMGVGGDVATEKEDLVVLDSGKGLVERNSSVPDTLDFGAAKDYSALEPLEEFVTVGSLSVAADGLDIGLFLCHNPSNQRELGWPAATRLSGPSYRSILLMSRKRRNAAR